MITGSHRNPADIVSDRTRFERRTPKIIAIQMRIEIREHGHFNDELHVIRIHKTATRPTMTSGVVTITGIRLTIASDITYRVVSIGGMLIRIGVTNVAVMFTSSVPCRMMVVPSVDTWRFVHRTDVLTTVVVMPTACDYMMHRTPEKQVQQQC